MRKLLFVLTYLALTIPCSADIIYVDDDASTPGNGLTWATAYKYLADALGDPNLSYHDQIWIAEGIYTPDANSAVPAGSGNRSASFKLINGVGLYGGFPAAGTWSQREPNMYDAILTGDIGTAEKRTQPAYGYLQ